MPDAQEITARIEAFLNSPREVSAADLGALAASYARMCKSANARLRRCADYLRRGLRCEAIYHAEIEPDLLDQAGALELGAVDKWTAVCKEEGFEQASSLLLDVAHELNEAYALEQPVAELLKRQRVLALMKAPLRARLDVLRSLAAADPNNTARDKQLEEYETARLAEIKADAKKASKTKDLAKLERSLRELTEERWRISLPASLIDALQAAVRRTQVGQALDKLKALLPELNDAYGAQDIEECVRLLQTWAEIVRVNHVQVPPDLDVQVQPVTKWIAGITAQREHQRLFKDACTQLEQALNADAGTAELQRYYLQAHSFDQPLPEQLERRYATRIAEAELAQRRRNRLRVALIVPLVVAAGIAVYLVLQGMEERRAIERARGTLAGLVADRKLGRAGDFIEDLERREPKVDWRTELAPQLDDLKTANAEGEQRRQELESVLAEARKALQKEVPLEDLRQLHRRLGATRELADDTEQKTELENTLLAVQERIDVLQKEIDDRFVEQRTTVEQKLAELHQLDPAQAPEVFHRKLDELQVLYKELMQVEGVSPSRRDDATSLRDMIDLYKSRLTQHRLDQRRSRDKQEAIQNLVNHLKNPDELASALREIATTFTGDADVQDFTEAADQVQSWWAVTRGAEVLRACQQDLVPSGPNGIAQRIQAIDDYLNEHPNSPFAVVIGRYSEYLHGARIAVADDGPWRGTLRTIVGLPLWVDLLYIKVKKNGSQKVYYVKSLEKVKGKLVAEVVLDTELTKTQTKQFRRDADVEGPKESPQSILAGKIHEIIDGFKDEDWATLGLDLAELVRSSTEVDVVLRAQMLAQLCESMLEQGWQVDEQIHAILRRLKRLDVDNITSLDPDDLNARPRRASLERELDKLPPFERIRKNVTAKQAELWQSLRLGYVGNGVVVRDNDAWRLRARGRHLQKGRKIMAVVESASGDRLRLRVVGEIENAESRLDEGRLAGVRPGTMVFIWEERSE